MKRIYGITMLETLIASAILFSALAIFSLAVKTNLISQRKYTEINQLLAPLPIIMASVQGALRSNPTERSSGSGEVLGVRFRYSASSIAFLPPPNRFDPDMGDFSTYSSRYRLYDVDLYISTKNISRRYRYREFAWLPEMTRSVVSP